MAKSAKYWDDRAIRRLTDAEKQSDEYIKRIQKMYDRANRNVQRDIEAIYARYSKSTGLDVQSLKELLTASETDKLWAEMKRKGLDKYVKGNYKARISRLEKIQAQIYAKAKEIYPEEQLQHTMCYEGVINNSYYKTIYDTQMGTGFDFAFSKIDDNMMSTLLNEPWSGKSYSTRIWGNTDILADSLAEIIGGALVSGQSIEKTSRQIRERFNVGKYYAERLVRTEINHFNNEADAMAYEEMDVDKYVFLATLDTRTSTMCQEKDNKVFPLKDRQVGVNFPPLHPNCRSKTRAYMGEEIEKTLKRRARNPVTGKNEIVGNVSYEEWAKQHGINTQKAFSGKDIVYAGGANAQKDLKKPANSSTITADNYTFNTIAGDHTLLDDLGTPQAPTVNPNFSKGGDYEDNCAHCGAALEMRRRGFDVEARPCSGMSLGKYLKLFDGAKPIYLTSKTSLELAKEIKAKLLEMGNGARGVIGAQWKNVDVGHIFSWEVVDDAVWLVDGQSGEDNVSRYLALTKPEDTVIVRLDNTKPTAEIAKACKNRGGD